jgi:hypothetical protein
LLGSYLYQKSCGGPNVACLTALSVGELSVAFALFAKRAGHKLGRARSELDATQKEQLSEAEAWMLSNPRISQLLATDPLRLVLGRFRAVGPEIVDRAKFSAIFRRRRARPPPRKAMDGAEHRRGRLERQLWSEVRDTCRQYALLEPNDHVMVALSGGKDSYTLLHVFDAARARSISGACG